MENLNKSNINKPRKKTLVAKKQLNDCCQSELANDVKQSINDIVENKSINLMARRYQLAYTKLYNELPGWKQQSFNNVTRNDDTLYNEFINSVIALAENENQQILLTA